MRFPLCLLWLYASWASAFDSVPEYRTVIKDRSVQYVLDRSSAEYSSDYLNYQLPAAAEREWLLGKNQYQFSVGSLSSKEFLVEQRLRIQSALAGPLDFQLTWFDESDWDENQQDFFWELGLKSGRHWRWLSFGNIDSNKAENDIGVGGEYHFDSLKKLRFAVLFPDFQRNIRSQDDTEWTSRPVVWSVVGSSASTDTRDFYQYYLRYEPRSVLHNKAQQTYSGLEKYTLGLNGTHDAAWQYRLHIDLKREVQETQVLKTVYYSSRYMTTLDYTWKLENLELRPGVFVLYRRWDKNSQYATVTDYTPSFWVSFPVHSRSDWSTQHQVGWDMVIHQLDNPSVIAEDRSDEALESRLNYRYEIGFNERGSLGFIFSMDLDEFGSPQTWEGGAAQLRLFF